MILRCLGAFIGAWFLGIAWKQGWPEPLSVVDAVLFLLQVAIGALFVLYGIFGRRYLARFAPMLVRNRPL